MKQLLLIRHAKSSWADFSTKDFDRPLNDRGKKDAPEMAKRLLDKDITIDAFIASPAKRARKTAELFVKEFKEKKDNIIFLDELYMATSSAFYNVISKTDDDFKTIAVFSHNEGITDFANSLTDKKIDNIPTSGIFAIKIKTKHWSDFQEAEKEFWFFDSPKKG
ncbi:MAG TPA: histidine phosphatase family protein [Chitinophagaceae bacterium]|nr:histidine phosphatase family protein [Chitinophagaceae bacterium]